MRNLKKRAAGKILRAPFTERRTAAGTESPDAPSGSAEINLNATILAVRQRGFRLTCSCIECQGV